MSDASRQAHWENLYTTKGEKEVSWFQDKAAPSLELIALTRLSVDAAIIDIGGGASRLIDDLIARKFYRLTVLDLSGAALAATKQRLGESGAVVQWVIADVTKWEPVQMYDVWHDRAAFRFLTDQADQSTYVDRTKRAVKPGGLSQSASSNRVRPCARSRPLRASRLQERRPHISIILEIQLTAGRNSDSLTA